MEYQHGETDDHENAGDLVAVEVQHDYAWRLRELMEAHADKHVVAMRDGSSLCVVLSVQQYELLRATARLVSDPDRLSEMQNYSRYVTAQTTPPKDLEEAFPGW